MNIIIIIIDLNLKHILSNKVIVYKDETIFNILSAIVVEFENVFIDIENIINLSKE